MAVTNSFLNIMSSLIPWGQNGGSGETDAQVKILIYHHLTALRGVYKITDSLDDPVLSTGIHNKFI